MKAEAFKQKCIGRAPLVHRLGSRQPLRNRKDINPAQGEPAGRFGNFLRRVWKILDRLRSAPNYGL